MASYDLPGVGRTRFAIESSFGTDMTSDVAANFFDIRHTAFDFLTSDVMAADPTVVQRQWQQRNQVRGPAKWSGNLQCHLVGSNEAITSAVTATKSPQSRLMEALLGGYTVDLGSTVEASPSPTTTGFTVAAGHGSRFDLGQLLFVTVSGVVHARMVTAVSTDALTIWPALPAAPAAAAVVYNAQNVYPTDRPTASIQILDEKAVNRNNIHLGLAAQGDLSLTLDRGNLAMWATSLTGARYKHDDDITTPQGGSAIAAASHSGTSPFYVVGSALHFGPTSVSTLALIPNASLTVNLARTWIEVGDYSGVHGVGQWHIARSEITAELTLPITAETYWDAHQAQTDYGMLLQLQSTAGESWAIAMPTMQITAVTPAESNGLVGSKLSLLVKENTKIGTTNELTRAPFVMAQG